MNVCCFVCNGLGSKVQCNLHYGRMSFSSQFNDVIWIEKILRSDYPALAFASFLAYSTAANWNEIEATAASLPS